jgi:hypothetical protein
MKRSEALAELWQLIALIVTMGLLSILLLAAGYPYMKLFPITFTGFVIGTSAVISLYFEFRRRP